MKKGLEKILLLTSGLLIGGALIYLPSYPSINNNLYAQEVKEKVKSEKTLKLLTGEVGGLGPNFIAIVYEKDEEKGIEYEIALPLAKDASFQSIQNLKELEVGDKVTIQYEEETSTYKEKVKDTKGEEKEELKKESKREGKIVRFDSRPQKSSIYVGSETEEIGKEE